MEALEKVIQNAGLELKNSQPPRLLRFRWFLPKRLIRHNLSRRESLDYVFFPSDKVAVASIVEHTSQVLSRLKRQDNRAKNLKVSICIKGILFGKSNYK
jgi:hypothetical protein